MVGKLDAKLEDACVVPTTNGSVTTGIHGQFEIGDVHLIKEDRSDLSTKQCPIISDRVRHGLGLGGDAMFPAKH